MTTATVLAQLLVLVPAAAAAVSLGLARPAREVSRWVSSLSSLVMVGLAAGLWAASPASGTVSASTVGPLQVGELHVPLELLVDRPFAIAATAVALVGAGVQFYSMWYLDPDPRAAVFQSTVSVFVAAMLLVVLSGDLLITLIGWEVMGWGSYLLIGHYTQRTTARRAAMKAFLLTRFADIGFVLGLVWLASQGGTTQLTSLFSHFEAAGVAAPVGALVLMLIGVAGKSGLIPFHDWLPDAMEGPTPASALIHGATMVAAGTVVVARLYPLYVLAPGARVLLAVLAGATMVYTGVVAFSQRDVKKLLAYSTMSQVAMMLGALAAAPADDNGVAGLDHLVSHAMFKALLFLAAGWVAAAGGGTAFALLRGRLKGWGVLPVSFAIGLAALSGLPPTIGFISKDGLVEAAKANTGAASSIIVWTTLLAVVLTALYATRAYLLLVTGTAEHGEHHDPLHAPPPTGGRLVMVGAVISVLAFFSLFGGFVLLALGSHIDWGIAATSTVLALVGVGAAVALSRRPGGDPASALSQRWNQLAQANLNTDRLYAGFAAGVVALARVVVDLDNRVVDSLPRGLAAGAVETGDVADKAHRGIPSSGLIGVLAGALVVLVLGVTLWH